MVDGKENIKFDLGVKELSGGMIDFWYLKWQKQERHIKLFPKNICSQEKVQIIEKITLKWWCDWLVIFKMTEARKTHWAFSYSPVISLDFGFYIQTVWD